MKPFSVVGLLLALGPIFIDGHSPIRVMLKKETLNLESNLKSTNAISMSSNSSSVFSGVMSLGTPAKSFNFVFDTTSNLVWIPGTNCINCVNTPLFNSTQSSTFMESSPGNQILASFNLFGEIMYTLCSDTLIVNGLNATNQTFGLVTSVTNSMNGISGFAGLGPGNMSFVKNILNQNNMSSIFSLYINPSSSGTEAGEIILGNSSTAQPIVTVPSVTQDVQWQITIQNISVGDTSIPCNSCSAQISILDNPYITGPNGTIQSIYQAIQANSSGFVNQSDNLPSVSFMIGGTNFDLTSDDYLLSCVQGKCPTKFVADTTGQPQFILGTAFVSKYHWTFNLTTNEITIASYKSGSSALQPALFILTSLVWTLLYSDKMRSN